MTDPLSPGMPPAQAWDEQQWRRPQRADQGDVAPPMAPPPPVYTGPPRTDPAAATWRPQTVMRVPPPRPLPMQDDAVIDGQEMQARTVTYGVGLIVGAVVLIVLIILCGRVLF